METFIGLSNRPRGHQYCPVPDRFTAPSQASGAWFDECSPSVRPSVRPCLLWSPCDTWPRSQHDRHGPGAGVKRILGAQHTLLLHYTRQSRGYPIRVRSWAA